MFKNSFFLQLFIVVLSFHSCKKNQTVTTLPSQEIASNSYTSEWAEIDQMEKKGLGKSIIVKTDSLLESALNENNITQIFKALAYRSKYSNQIEEEAALKILTNYEDRIKSAKFPLKQLLHSATAELYFQYYNQYRWRFNQRTTTINSNEKDIRSWSLDQILNAIRQHYLSSLKPINDLAQFPTSSFKTILTFPKDTSSFNLNQLKYRPSLFDFLADRALHYFEGNEGRVTKPINEFNIDQYPVFSLPEQYSKIHFSAEDTLSNQYLTVKLYQALTSIHQEDTDPTVLINFELDRLKHLHIISNDDLKDSLYLNVLSLLSKQHSTHHSADEIQFQIAQLYFQLGSLYNNENPEDEKKWYIKKAHEICIRNAHHSTFGGEQCRALLESIEATSFSFQVENTYVPNRPILFRFQYKNIDSVYFRLVKIPHSHEAFQNSEDLISYLLKSPSEKSWKELLPNPKDFRLHSIELFTDELSKGNYYLLASTVDDFNLNRAQVTYAKIEISSLSYFSRQTPSGDEVEVFVKSREKGKPILNAEIRAYTNKYSYSTRSTSMVEIGTFNTDKKGYSKFSGLGPNQNLQFSIYTKDDTLSSNSNYYLYNRNQEVRKSVQVHFFTDRAIYRPGQIVYFKGIYIESNGKTKKVKKDYKNDISLYNVNGEKLTTLSLTTNNYGSIEGSFILPSSGLNGQYRIQSKHGSQYFSVEEYKRPTFSIEIDSSTTQIKINEDIAISGIVKSFSGLSLSNSKLKYRIVRRASYPFWSPYRSFYPPSNEKEIANGFESTDQNGLFSFQFLAQADPGIKSQWNPIYNYDIILEATNPQGETQSLTKTIKLSEQAIFLSASVKDEMQLDDLKKLVVAATNIEGRKVNSRAILSLWKLKTPTSAKKQKLWAKVDQSNISEREFDKKFPFYPDNNELSIEAFPKDYEITNTQIECNQSIDLFRNINPGAYELIATAEDQFGNSVLWKKRFILYDNKSNSPPYPLFTWLASIDYSVDVGDTAKLIFASSLQNLNILYEIEHENKIIRQEWLIVNEEQKKIEIPINESYRGGLTVHFSGIHSGRMIKLSQTINVPFSNKKLDITLGTFRDEISPASEEKWTLTINKHNGDAAAAELLASMYDQSLDQFIQKDWRLNLYRQNSTQHRWDLNQSFNSTSSSSFSLKKNAYSPIPRHSYPSLNWFGFQLGYSHYGRKSIPMLAESMSAGTTENVVVHDESAIEEVAIESSGQEGIAEGKTTKQIQIRSDFKETVFFYPQLRTDTEGTISFEFKMPDAFTQWKFRALAYTEDLEIGMIEQSLVTQKELMIVPNTPRFFREDDELVFKALISNMSEKALSGHAKLRFYNASDGNPIDIFPELSADLPFEIIKGENTVVSWKIKIPKGIDAMRYTITAQTENYSDGEEKTIPVLKNRMLVTESLPLWIRSNEKKSFTFKKLLSSNSLKELSHESFSLEFTPNPVWYAIQALPNLANNGNECSEQVFSRLYANSLAEKIADNHPKIKSVFEQWKSLNSNELTSKLMQNQELKSILIEETPWLQKAKNESEQKLRIALLFDYNKMAQEKRTAIDKLIELQLPNGGWSWYKGMRDNRYITQYIIEGIGHLMHLGIDIKSDQSLSQMLKKGINYLDNRLIEDYQALVENQADLSKNHLSQIHIHYLYTRSFFKEIPLPEQSKAFDYYLAQSQKFWLKRGLYEQGMIALSIHRWKENSQIPQQIVSSLTDNALIDEEMGMYWKSNSAGYYWHQSPVETQALLIELYQELEYSSDLVDDLKIWLLKQKQTQSWSNSKATAKACYALLMGNDIPLIYETPELKINVNGNDIDFSSVEPGTSYFKKVWNKKDVKEELGNIVIEKKDKGIAWGAAYWQYYQDLDKITESNESGLKLNKKIFKSVITNNGELIIPIDELEVSVGDKIKVRIELESDRTLEFVHLKDMRASAFEPINVISKCKYQDGFGYYESTKDASTNFFIDWLPKGVYVFEYELRASQEGNFSNGISTIQCQYAPEFSAHSVGTRIKIVSQ